jgi:RNA 3'-terminal phosphate cyclase-like protein
MGGETLRVRGSQQLRKRLMMATLAGSVLRVDDIRAEDAAPGLRDYEASLLRLLEKISHGCVVEINETGSLSVPLAHLSIESIS